MDELTNPDWEPVVSNVNPIPMNLWGADHWSTLLYAEVCAVDSKGILDKRKMRTHGQVHPQFDHAGRGDIYPTRLNNGAEITYHDDWSCLEDMEKEGLLSFLRNGYQGRVLFNRRGFTLAHELRIRRAKGLSVTQFTPEGVF